MKILKTALATMMFLLLSTIALAENTCGTNITWTLSENGTLNITGTGAMYDYDGYDMPWYDDRDQITEVVVSEGITSLGDSAFSGCRKLLNVQLPESLRSIGESAFDDCTRLTLINIPSDVLIIKQWTFSGCDSLSNIELPSSLKSIAEYAFFDCDGLTEIDIPASVTSIDKKALSACERLNHILVDENNQNYTSIDGVLFSQDRSILICYPAGKMDISYEIPESVTTIDDYAFYYNGIIEEIVVPSNVAKIGECAFAGCKSLLSIELTEGVQSIGQKAFSECDYLQDVTFPASLVSLGSEPFGMSQKLLNIYVNEKSDTYKSIDGVLFSADGKTLIAFPSGRNGTYEIPNDTIAIGDMAFKGNYELKSVKFPEGLITIGDRAFMSCAGISELDFPNTLTTIKDGAFWGCDGLTNVILPANVESFHNGAFSYCENLRNVTFMGESTCIEGYNGFFLCSSNMTITGIKGSTAEEYAQSEGITFVVMESDMEKSGTSDENQKCSNCGYEVEDKKRFKFCPECGKEFE